MPKVHLVLQGKGGVGKSLVATLLAQYKASLGELPLCIDVDPVNATFQAFKALEVKFVNILEDKNINPRHFDQLLEMILTSARDVIIDNGASSFLPLLSYLQHNHTTATLAEHGYELIVHTVITGGQAMLDTLNGFASLASQFAQIVIWLNPYWGPIVYEGKQFTQLKVYLEHKTRIVAIINLPELDSSMFGRDFSEMLQAGLTFPEALADSGRFIVVRQRLKMIRDQLFTQLKQVEVLA